MCYELMDQIRSFKNAIGWPILDEFLCRHYHYRAQGTSFHIFDHISSVDMILRYVNVYVHVCLILGGQQQLMYL